MSKIQLSSFLIPDEIAMEGILFDNKHLQASSKMHDVYYDSYGTKYGALTYPSKNFNALISHSWFDCPSDFNEGGVRYMGELTKALEEGEKFVKLHGVELGQLIANDRKEMATDIIIQFNNIFSGFVASNQMIEKGKKPFNGVPEEIKNSVKKEIMKQSATVARIMQWAAKEYTDFKTYNFDNKSYMKRLLNKQYSKEAFESDPHVLLHYELYKYCEDWYTYMVDNILN